MMSNMLCLPVAQDNDSKQAGPGGVGRAGWAYLSASQPNQPPTFWTKRMFSTQLTLWTLYSISNRIM